jgi:hypothetical protein
MMVCVCARVRACVCKTCVGLIPTLSLVMIALLSGEILNWFTV